MPKRANSTAKKLSDGGKTKGDKLIEKKLDKRRKIIGTPKTRTA